jgi:hypothetical protein
MSKQQLIIEETGEEVFAVRSTLTVSSGHEVEGLSGLLVRPGEELEIVVLSKTGKGVDLWLLAQGHDIDAFEPEDFVHQRWAGTLRVELEAHQTMAVRVSRLPLGPSETREYYIEACKRGDPMPEAPTGEGASGTLNTSPG